jgi:hypothetical protein
VNGVTACVFDERLFFSFSDLSTDQLSEAVISISVYDANTILRNKLVGRTVVDLLTVYSMDSHEIFKTWFALIDNEDEEDKGIQGYIKLSIFVQGPGDRQKVITIPYARLLADHFAILFCRCTEMMKWTTMSSRT